ncbi:MAG: hypothetical protein H6779_02270 [Candidatus Nomurabacteria bacterium]|nr:hypothetical protein [Candidatus Nomurabacteria bacterium]USN88249.1 MAG: hypothetical protein H6779_02270 [Candidatus Nomurabacteria bacterium]
MFEQKKAITASIIVAFIQIYLVTFHFSNTLFVTSGLLISVLYLWWQFSFARSALIMFVVIAVCGFSAEAIVVTQGAWVYQTQHWLSLPLWLPILWGSVGVALLPFSKILLRTYGEK